MPRPRKEKTVPAVKPARAPRAKAIKPAFLKACADAASDKKAEDITLLDMRGLSSFTDYFLICSGASEPQLKAIANGVRQEMKEKYDRKPIYEDGFPASQWVILDFGDLLIHIFHKDKRGYYGLEDLWSDAKPIPYTPA
jgi:ribosome-associated protein